MENAQAPIVSAEKVNDFLENHANYFLVQEHAARRHHYDIRLRVKYRGESGCGAQDKGEYGSGPEADIKLESDRVGIERLDGGLETKMMKQEREDVLRSWAVPKGISSNPGVKRLAQETTDHGLSYARYEGAIPRGSYGAGTTMAWDMGTYTVPIKKLKRGKRGVHLDDDEDESETESSQGSNAQVKFGEREQKRLMAGLDKGHVTIIFHGQKLNGEYAFFRLPNTKIEPTGPRSARHRSRSARASTERSTPGRSVTPGTNRESVGLDSDNDDEIGRGAGTWLLIKKREAGEDARTTSKRKAQSAPSDAPPEVIVTHPLSVLTGLSIQATGIASGADVDAQGHWVKLEKNDRPIKGARGMSMKIESNPRTALIPGVLPSAESLTEDSDGETTEEDVRVVKREQVAVQRAPKKRQLIKSESSLEHVPSEPSRKRYKPDPDAVSSAGVQTNLPDADSIPISSAPVLPTLPNASDTDYDSDATEIIE
ncbi:DNA polymerase ligase-domain-containing protein [Phlyctochytrium arcticum]|nr:DNA polymerase ligase-domain-containing protein [Phlyctochytrium arcticum]